MPEISYQLYTSRDAADQDAVLANIKTAGYDAVEGFGPWLEDPAGTKARIDAAGLKMTSGHFALDAIEADAGKVIDTAKQLGITRVYAPYLMPEDRPTDANGWRAFAERLAKAGQPIVDAGLTFGWHNHDFEMVDLGDGVCAEDLIAETGVALELDLGWVFRAGTDPVAAIEKYGAQISSLHIKDKAAEGENPEQDGWATVGQGVMDWSAILAAARKHGITHYVIENDHPVDEAAFLRDSAAFLKSLPEVSA